MRENPGSDLKMVGFVPEEKLPHLYALSSVFVLPSLYCESFGITLLEAMASGKPVVASNVGGVPEIVENEVTGLLFRRGNPEDLAEKILKILNDQNLASYLASNAREHVKKNYSWTIIADKTEEIYKKALEHHLSI